MQMQASRQQLQVTQTMRAELYSWWWSEKTHGKRSLLLRVGWHEEALIFIIRVIFCGSPSAVVSNRTAGWGPELPYGEEAQASAERSGNIRYPSPPTFSVKLVRRLLDKARTDMRLCGHTASQSRPRQAAPITPAPTPLAKSHLGPLPMPDHGELV